MTTTSEVLAPPTERYTILGWLRKNLFGSVGDTILTLVAAWLTYAMLNPSLRWVFGEARWQVVADNLKLFMVGRYPAEELWRVWAVLYLLALLVGFLWGVWVKGKETAAYVLVGNRKGGLAMATLALYVIGILLASVAWMFLLR